MRSFFLFFFVCAHYTTHYTHTTHTSRKSFLNFLTMTRINWVQEIINKTDARKKQKLFKSKYRPLPHVAPTSNVCERLFSRAKLIMRPHRKHMSPFHLEMMVFCAATRRYGTKLLWRTVYLSPLIMLLLQLPFKQLFNQTVSFSAVLNLLFLVLISN